jgi:T5SS/PEP-CTERM-associated repeat protein
MIGPSGERSIPADIILTPIVTSGAAPTTPPGTNFLNNSNAFDDFAPTISRDGLFVAHQGTLALGGGITATNDTGIWLNGQDVLAQEGTPAPGVAGGNFGALSVILNNPPHIAAPGQAAFIHTVSGAGITATNDTGIWAGAIGSLTLVAREGDPAPDLGGPTFGNFAGTSQNFVVNENGDLAFLNTLVGASITTDSAIWLCSGGTTGLLAREGSAAPGMPAGAVFTGSFSATSIQLNDARRAAFAGVVAGGGVVPANDAGIWFGSPGSVQLVVREGDPIPGAGAGQNFGPITATTNFSLNSAGHVAFANTATGFTPSTNEIIFAGDPTNLQQLASEGSPAPGMPAGAVFGPLSSAHPVINANDQVAFLATGTGGGVLINDDEAIWSGPAGRLRIVVREDAQAPGVATGTRHADPPSQFHLNSAGQLVFQGALVGTGVTTSNDSAIFATDTIGQLRLVVREGDSLSGETITKLSLVGGLSSGGEDGRRSPISDNGEIVFATEHLAAGTSRIVKATLDEVLVDRTAVVEPHFVLNDGRTFTVRGPTHIGRVSLDNSLTIAGGSVLVSNGPANTISEFFIAPGGSNSVTVTGAGSTWSLANGLEVGGQGQGVLNVRDGARVSGPTTTLTVSDAFDNPLSSGTVNVSSATVEFNRIHVGTGRNGTGTVNISGDGASVSTANLDLGADGPFNGALAVVNVNAPGTLTVSQQFNLWPFGSLNINGGTVRLPGINVAQGAVDFNAGTLEFPANSTVDDTTLDTVFGPAHSIVAGQTLRLSGTPTVAASLVINGGTLSVDSLSQLAPIQFNTGSLALTAASLTIGSGGLLGSDVVLPAGKTVAIAGPMSGVSISPSSRLTLAGGTLAGPSVSNNGLIRGDGRIEGAVVSSSSGELRVATGERLEVIGAAASHNSGLIDVVGGHVEFQGGLNNARSTGMIFARNAVLRFGSGLDNAGSVRMSFGANDVYGDIVNQPTGSIVVSGGSNATFVDDVDNGGSIQVTAAGNLQSTAVFFGALSGNGVAGGGHVFLEGDARPGHSAGTMAFGGDLSFGSLAKLAIEVGGSAPGVEFDRVTVAGSASLAGTLDVGLINGFSPTVPGQTFAVLTAASIAGTFDDIVGVPSRSDPGLFWTVSYTPTTVILSTSALPGDINLDGQVDRIDTALFTPHLGTTTGAIWITGDFDADGMTTLLDLALQQSNLGATLPSPATSAYAVPEPAGAVLVAFATAIVFLHRRRASAAGITNAE